MKLDLIDGLKSGKKLSGRDIQMVFIFVGLIVAVLVYLLVFNNYTEKNDKLKKDIEDRNAYLSELKGYEANLPMYKASVEKSKANISANLARLPVGLENEDFLLWLIRADEKIGSDSTSVSFGEIDVPLEFSTYIGGKYIPVKGFRAPITVSMMVNYKQFKEYLKYIYDSKQNFTFVDSVALTYNSETADLTAVYGLSKFYVEYENGVYTPEPSFDIPLGNPDPFHTK